MKAIDGEELMDRVDFILSRLKSTELVSVFQNLKSYLENAHTLTLDDLRPKGRWESPLSIRGRQVRCSVCGVRRDVYTQAGWDFCPNCGADMRGGGEEGEDKP